MVEAVAANHADLYSDTSKGVRPPVLKRDLLSHPTVRLSRTSALGMAIRRGGGIDHLASACREVSEISFRELLPGDVVVLDLGVRLLMLIKAKTKRWTEVYCYMEGDSEHVQTVLISTGGTCAPGRPVRLYTDAGRVETKPIRRVLTSGPNWRPGRDT